MNSEPVRAQPVDTADIPEPNSIDFSGRLSAFRPANLLQWANGEACNGALVIRHGSREKRIYFVDGNVVACASSRTEEYFGQRLLIYGYLEANELRWALDTCAKTGQRLGTTLVKLRLLDEATVQAALRAQIEEAVCDLFIWQHGVFFFEPEEASEGEVDVLAQPLDTIGLAFKGARWSDEYRRIRRLFVHDNIVLRRGVVHPRLEPSLLEQRIVGLVDGRSTLADIYRQVRGSYYLFLQTTYKLCVGEVLDISEVGERHLVHGEDDDLGERIAAQAMREARDAASGIPDLPFDLVQRLIPVWVEPLSSEVFDELPTDIHRFCRRLDGQTRFGDAVDSSSTVRRRQVDFLILQLREGRLALTPKPVELIPV